MKVVVASVSPEGARSRRYVLQGDGGRRLAGFSAGAHIAVHVEIPGAGRQTRCYSLINPRDSETVDTYEIVVQHEARGRGGSEWLASELRPGSVLEIDAPRQAFSLAEGPEPVLLIGGGIGVTPILAMARTCEQTGRAYRLHYFARSSDDAPLAQAVRALRHGSVHLHLGTPVPEVRCRLRAIIGDSAPSTSLHVCGPKGLIEEAFLCARQAGWAERQLRCESFTAASGSDDRSFSVRLASSGRLITVPADRTMLHALAENGVQLPTSCGAGICGSCLVTVLSGRVDHRDSFLSDEEKNLDDMMCACVSRAAGDEIEIDL